MSFVGLPGGVPAAADDDDDIDGVPLQPLPSATAWPPQTFTAAFIPASLPASQFIPVINPVKAALFTSGITPVLSVNRVEQERAAAEDKKRRQEVEAKAVYADFVASFAVSEQQQQQAQPTAKPARSPFTAFVRGGTIGGDSTAAVPAVNSTSAKRAEPAAPVSTSAVAAVEPPWKRRRPASPPPPMPPATIEPALAFTPALPPPAGRGKPRNIDLFLAELKQRQAEQPQPVREDTPHAASPATTNVFIAGLPLTTTESELADEMVRFGDIASVKLLYPRTEEERSRSTMNGFVAYMSRRDAEDAMREMNGVVWRGHPLKLHWSKPVTLPHTPVATKANRRDCTAAATANQLTVQRVASDDQRSQGSTEDNAGSHMTSDDIAELHRLLSTLTLQRVDVLAAMGWCMERAVAAAYIVRSICTALLSSSSDSCRRVSLLYLLSDLLFNSSAPVRNASLFRREAATQQHNTLHSVWTAFSPQHHNASKRQKEAEQPGSGSSGGGGGVVEGEQKRQRVGRKEREVVLSVLRTWQTWSLFEGDKIEQWMMCVRGLQAAPAALANAQSAAAPAAPAAASTADVDDVDGVPLQ